jgi:hypothetical protein
VFTLRAGGGPFDEIFVSCGRPVSCLPDGALLPGGAVTFDEEGTEGVAPSPGVTVFIHLSGLLLVNICSVALVLATSCAVRAACPSLSSRRRLGEVALMFV